MKPYSSKTGKVSGVKSYEIGDDYIVVQFDTAVYRYTYLSAGKAVIEKMKMLAMASEGLSTFISQNGPVFEKLYKK